MSNNTWSAGRCDSHKLLYWTEVRDSLFNLSCIPPQDVIGFNMAGLDYLRRECEAKSEVMFFADATSHLEEKKRKRKKREKLILSYNWKVVPFFTFYLKGLVN